MTPIFLAASAAVRPLAISTSASRSFAMISSAVMLLRSWHRMPSFSCVHHLILAQVVDSFEGGRSLWSHGQEPNLAGYSYTLYVLLVRSFYTRVDYGPQKN